jgi:hypothetical protein
MPFADARSSELVGAEPGLSYRNGRHRTRLFSCGGQRAHRLPCQCCSMRRRRKTRNRDEHADGQA